VLTATAKSITIEKVIQH